MSGKECGALPRWSGFAVGTGQERPFEPKRMRKLANRFYTRVADYREPLASRDRGGLERALRSRAYGEGAAPDEAVAFLAAHMIESADAYERVGATTFLSGRLDEPVEETHDR